MSFDRSGTQPEPGRPPAGARERGCGCDGLQVADQPGCLQLGRRRTVDSDPPTVTSCHWH